MEQQNKVILDNGSGVIKAGFQDRDVDAPNIKFPAIVGRPREGLTALDDAQGKGFHIGEEAEKLRGILNLSYPVKYGLVENWDDMKSVWEYLYNNELRVDSKETYTMLTEAPHNPKSNREKMCEMMFEQFHVLGFYVAVQAVLSLYSNGRTTGVVCDTGDGISHTVPVFEGFSVNAGISKSAIAGRSITDYLQQLFELSHGSDRGANNFREVMQGIKEVKDMMFVSLDFKKDQEVANSSTQLEMPYEMPDGNVVSLNHERFEAPEVLFNPALLGKGDAMGLHQMVQRTITECDLDIRKELYQNIILSGGSSLFKNLPERLNMEMCHLCPKADLVKILAPEHRYYSVWQGGNILCGLATFENQWITKAEYDECGSKIVHRKCK